MEEDTRRMLPVGTLLHNGKYKIVSYLKSGGFANTYIVEDSEDGKYCALKEFFIKGTNERRENGLTVTVSNKDNRDQYDKQLKKFKKEASMLKGLHHKNIVRVYSDFEENGTHYYVMDFLTGGSLADRINKGKTYTEAEVMKLLPPILEALECIHKQKLWHLDLKPGNIMLDKDEADNCTSQWTTLNGVHGRLFKGPSGGSVFLPAAGYHWRDGLRIEGDSGYYWSSTQYPYDDRSVYFLSFGSGGVSPFPNNRLVGLSVRPISNAKNLLKKIDVVI